MAGLEELEKFVRKFVTLWQSGSDANLYVETKAGSAFVNLRVGLGQAHTHQGQHAGVRRGGGPAKQRRLERRAAAREASAAAAAEKAGAGDENREKDKIDEETLVKKKTEEAEDALEKVTNSPIPQVDGISESDSNICFEFRVEAHESCTHEDILESIEANFLGCLDDEKVEKDSKIRDLIVEESKDNPGSQNIRLYEVTVLDNEIVKKIIESWNTPYTFDDLAFKKAVRDEIVINIQKVQRLK